MEFRTGPEILDYVNGAELERYAGAGVVTPDHTIRTKNYPLLVPPPEAGRIEDFAREAACRRRAGSSPTTRPISRATTRRRTPRSACSIRCRA